LLEHAGAGNENLSDGLDLFIPILPAKDESRIFQDAD